MKTLLIVAHLASRPTREHINSYITSAEGLAVHPPADWWVLPYWGRPDADAAAQIRDRLVPLTEPGDTVVVIEIAGGWSAHGLRLAT